MIRVLIVEDQAIIRKSLGIILDMTVDIEVVGLAENGLAALKLAEQLQPDIVLMDIHMPEMDGVDATVQVKKCWPQIKVIILTTFQDLDYVTGALNAGAEGYILKAIDPADLASAIALVHRGETMITQEVARSLFSHYTQQNRQEAVPQESYKSLYGLTEREIQIIQYIAEGLGNRFIAERMFLSEGTVKNYISSIYSKLGVQNRAAAMRKAAEDGFIN